MITGSEISCPIMVVDKSRFSSAPIDVRGEAQFAERLDVVGDRQPLFAGSDQRGIGRLGQSLLRALLRNGDRLEPDVTGHG